MSRINTQLGQLVWPAVALVTAFIAVFVITKFVASEPRSVQQGPADAQRRPVPPAPQTSAQHTPTPQMTPQTTPQTPHRLRSLRPRRLRPRPGSGACWS